MNQRTDLASLGQSFASAQGDAGLARTARTRVRLPDAMAQSRVFPGWGPTV
ncbi:MAG: hypothetical protein JO324_05375 [Candidatus Eremiobacteraeota bacterium]|nr:hypothetical protein [Candidatus Eremiobacteraeota bacterium]